jgi:2-methylisocitrate lyase-like PEP mutase family enzyme
MSFAKTEQRWNGSRRGFIQAAGAAAGGIVAGSLRPGEAAAAGAIERGPLAESAATQSPGARLRKLLQGADLVLAPVIYDAMSAKLAELAGMPAVFAGGQPISNSMYGFGDFGMVTITELIEFASRIAGAVGIPVLADADDGGGNPLNVYRAIGMYERRGVAGVMIEDLAGAKHLPGLGEGQLVARESMVDKIHAACDARRADGGLVVVARCDAVSVKEPVERALERGVAYAEAGADVLFFAGMRLPDLPRAAEAVQRPLMHTVNNVPFSDISKNRVRLAVYAGQLQSVALGAVHQALLELKADGVIPDYGQRALPAEVHARLTGAEEAVARARKYHALR